MKTRVRLALVGDFNPAVVAHACIPRALELASLTATATVKFSWLNTADWAEFSKERLETFDGFWCVPGSPYKNKAAALEVIQFARLRNVPYLGTCGGCQHAVLEFAMNQLGIAGAGIEEEDRGAAVPLISALSCRLTDESQNIYFAKESNLRAIYGRDEVSEEYRCGFGVNPKYVELFKGSDLAFSAFNHERVPQAIELLSHPFFIGTAFQPERSSRTGQAHPLIQSFTQAMVDESRKRNFVKMVADRSLTLS